MRMSRASLTLRNQEPYVELGARLNVTFPSGQFVHFNIRIRS
jgi:hypothetical protein